MFECSRCSWKYLDKRRKQSSTKWKEKQNLTCIELHKKLFTRIIHWLVTHFSLNLWQTLILNLIPLPSDNIYLVLIHYQLNRLLSSMLFFNFFNITKFHTLTKSSTSPYMSMISPLALKCHVKLHLTAFNSACRKYRLTWG